MNNCKICFYCIWCVEDEVDGAIPPCFFIFEIVAGYRGEGDISNRALNGRLVVIL